MSANISNNSLRRNVETGISLNIKELSDLELIFDTMYNYADIVRFVNKRNVDIVKKSYKPLPSSILGSLTTMPSLYGRMMHGTSPSATTKKQVMTDMWMAVLQAPA
jgi:hypothetical protein